MGLVYLHKEKILVTMKDYHSDKCPPSTSVCKDLLFDFSSLFMTCYKQLTIIFRVFIVKVEWLFFCCNKYRGGYWSTELGGFIYVV